MKKLLIFFACVACRATHCLLRLLSLGATSLPGAVALKICPDILRYAAQNVSIIAVTGTNGKTTTSRIIERALGDDVCANRSGANLKAGITATLIMNLGITGRPKCRRAVIECDEAVCRTALSELKPKALAVTNLLRDQLDRYGSVKTPRDCIAEGLRSSPDTLAVINADCPMAASIARIIGNKTVFFGADAGSGCAVGSGEDGLCPVCGRPLRYKRVSYACMGDYACSCGFHRPKPDVSADTFMPSGEFIVRAGGKSALCRSSLKGLYNAYNALCAAAAAVTFGIDLDAAAAAAGSFERGFGRMERFSLGKAGAEMILIKNAVAADEALHAVCAVSGDKTLVFAINSRTADGTDISWLDDVDLIRLRRGDIRRVYITGERASDAQKRFERDNIHCKIVENYDKLINVLGSEENYIYILPTYTAMLELRAKLVRALGGKNFWE